MPITLPGVRIQAASAWRDAVLGLRQLIPCGWQEVAILGRADQTPRQIARARQIAAAWPSCICMTGSGDYPSRRHSKNTISVKQRMGRSQRPCHPIMGSNGKPLASGLVEPGIGGDHSDCRIAATEIKFGIAACAGIMGQCRAKPAKLTVDFIKPCPSAAGRGQAVSRAH